MIVSVPCTQAPTNRRTVRPHIHLPSLRSRYNNGQLADNTGVAALPRSIMARAAAPRWALTLERALGPGFGSDAALQATGAFSAEVFPDLPIATTWGNLMKVVSK